MVFCVPQRVAHNFLTAPNTLAVIFMTRGPGGRRPSFILTSPAPGMEPGTLEVHRKGMAKE